MQALKQESLLGCDADANPLCPGRGAVSPNLSLLSAGLIYGAECLCQGKSPREQLWHFTAAPSPGVITLLAFLLLSGLEEQPSELSSGEMSQCGPTTLPRGLPGMVSGAFPLGVLLHPESVVAWAASCSVHCDVSLKTGML